jgi:hypothetical protein
MMILNKTVSITVLALVLFLVSGTFALADSFNIKRISVADMGSEGDGASSSASISADGRYVAFSSNSSNLVPDDTNGMGDVFVFDRNTNTIERVSVATSGEEANGSSFYSKTPISADGRYVAFASFASNLVAGDTNGVLDVFVHDRQTDVTERVSISASGTQSNNESYPSSISNDGRYVAFTSYASNLISNDSNGNSGDAFVYDRQTDTIEIVSISTGGVQGNQSSVTPSLSANGRYVAFRSQATNLVSGDTNNVQDIFVYDRNTDSIERVSVNNNGVQGNLDSSSPAISGDGRYVSFMADANNFVANDTNNVRDIFVYDRQTDSIKRVSVAGTTVQGNGDSSNPAISSNGRYVAFASDASNLVSGDTNFVRDIFVYDRDVNNVKRVSLTYANLQADNSSYSPAISANGLIVTFESDASNLVVGDTNNQTDIFVQVSKRVLPYLPPQKEPVVGPVVTPDPVLEKIEVAKQIEVELDIKKEEKPVVEKTKK